MMLDLDKICTYFHSVMAELVSGTKVQFLVPIVNYYILYGLGCSATILCLTDLAHEHIKSLNVWLQDP